MAEPEAARAFRIALNFLPFLEYRLPAPLSVAGLIALAAARLEFNQIEELRRAAAGEAGYMRDFRHASGDERSHQASFGVADDERVTGINFRQRPGGQKRRHVRLGSPR